MPDASPRQVDVRDIEALRAMVSENFGDWSEALVITQDMVNRFAELTGDRQWIHVDVERARRESPFGAPIVHGFLLLSLMPNLRAPQPFVLLNAGSATNFGSGGLRFLSPVPVGSSVHLRQRLKDVQTHRRGTLLTSEVAIHVVGAERPALLYDLQVLYVPAPTPAAPALAPRGSASMLAPARPRNDASGAPGP